MGCCLEDYRTRVGMWAPRTSWATGTLWHTSQGNRRVMFCLRTMSLCATALAVLVIIGGVEKTSGPGGNGEKNMQVLCREQDKNLKSGTCF
jgi:hypothetical protein